MRIFVSERRLLLRGQMKKLERSRLSRAVVVCTSISKQYRTFSKSSFSWRSCSNRCTVAIFNDILTGSKSASKTSFFSLLSMTKVPLLWDWAQKQYFFCFVWWTRFDRLTMSSDRSILQMSTFLTSRSRAYCRSAEKSDYCFIVERSRSISFCVS